MAFEPGRKKRISPDELIRLLRNYDLHKLKFIPKLKTKKDIHTLLKQTVSVNQSDFMRQRLSNDGFVMLYFDTNEQGPNKIMTFGEYLIWSLKDLVKSIDKAEFPKQWT